MKKSFKYRLFPNKKQQRLLQKQLDTCRWLYNHFLKERKNFWENDKISIKRFQQYKSLVILKKETLFFADIYSTHTKSCK